MHVGWVTDGSGRTGKVSPALGLLSQPCLTILPILDLASRASALEAGFIMRPNQKDSRTMAFLELLGLPFQPAQSRIFLDTASVVTRHRA